MRFHEVQHVFFMESVNVVAVSIVTFCSLHAIAKPTVRNPSLNLVMVLSEAGFEVTHGVSLADAPRVPQGFDFHYDGGLGPFQFLCNGGRRHFSQEPLKNDQLVGSPRTLVCMHGQAEPLRLPLYVPPGKTRDTR